MSVRACLSVRPSSQAQHQRHHQSERHQVGGRHQVQGRREGREGVTKLTSNPATANRPRVSSAVPVGSWPSVRVRVFVRPVRRSTSSITSQGVNRRMASLGARALPSRGCHQHRQLSAIPMVGFQLTCTS